jgi:predicted ABC-type transport system involved in lysophospholipase L1 biosynthesis ATPase subunit
MRPEDARERANGVAGIALGFEHPSDAGRVWVAMGGTHRLSLHPEAQARLLAAALDLRLDAGARLVLLGSDLSDLDAGQCRALRARVGLLPRSGGLLSQLNGWENITLPLGYHAPDRIEASAARVREWLAGFGADAQTLLPKLPEHMDSAEIRIVACVRALLEQPDLLLAECGGQGLEEEDGSWAARVAAAYHAACPGGTLVQLAGVGRGEQAGHALAA